MIEIKPPTKGSTKVDLSKPARTPRSKVRRGVDKTVATEAANVARELEAKGVLGVAEGEKLTQEALLSQYVMLDNIGAPTDVMADILQVSKVGLLTLKRRARELYISNLTEDGVMGTIGTAFHRIDSASRRAMALMATLEDKDPKALDAAKALVSFEAQKIELLVRTGAVKVKKRIEISGVLEPDGFGDPSLMSGEAAMRVLQLIALEGSTHARGEPNPQGRSTGITVELQEGGD